MALRFKCPHCKKPLSVKEHLAGKKAACPVCKKVLKIPVPQSTPADMEAFAASALVDPATEASQKQQEAAQTIDFSCPFCDAELHLPLAEGGKQTPCPECSHIIKVPLPKIDKTKDWRNVQRVGPSGAKENQQQQLEGAWGSTTDKARVSREALIEAEAILVEEAPVGAMGWIRRLFIFSAIAGAVVLGLYGMKRGQNQRTERKNLELALEAVAETAGDGEDSAKIDKDRFPPSLAGAIHLGVGEFYVDKRNAELAVKHFNKARACNAGGLSALERDAVLIHLARAQIELGGTEDEAFDKKRLDLKKDIPRELGRTLGAITDPNAQAVGMRHAMSKLLAKKLAPPAIGIFGKLGPDDNQQPLMVQAQKQGLLLLQADKEPAKLPDPARDIVEPMTRLKFVDYHARKGNVENALSLVRGKGPTIVRLYAAWAGAAVIVDERKTPAEALDMLQDALRAVQELRVQAPGWIVVDLVRLAAQADQMDIVDGLLKLLDPAYKQYAHLALYELQLAKAEGSAKEPSAEDLASKANAVSLPLALACQAWARRQVRLGYGSSVQDALRLLEPEHKNLRPFFHLGIALGDQDRGK